MGNYFNIQVTCPSFLATMLSPDQFHIRDAFGYTDPNTKIDISRIDENTVLHLINTDADIDAFLEVGDENSFQWCKTLENPIDVEGIYNGLDIRVPYLEFVEKLKKHDDKCIRLFIEYDDQNPDGRDIIFQYAKIDHDEDEFLASLE